MDAGDEHAAAAGGRVYRFVIAEIDRDVIDAVSGEAVEQQIARFGVVDVDLAAVGVLLTRGTWQLHAGQAINVLHQAAAIETIRRSEEHTSELQSLMRISYAVFCLKKKNTQQKQSPHTKTD